MRRGRGCWKDGDFGGCEVPEAYARACICEDESWDCDKLVVSIQEAFAGGRGLGFEDETLRLVCVRCSWKEVSNDDGFA